MAININQSIDLSLSLSAALKLNASKTKAIICGYREFVDRIPHDLPRIEVSGIPVPYVETAENLGVTPG